MGCRGVMWCGLGVSLVVGGGGGERSLDRIMKATRTCLFVCSFLAFASPTTSKHPTNHYHGHHALPTGSCPPLSLSLLFPSPAVSSPRLIRAHTPHHTGKILPSHHPTPSSPTMAGATTNPTASRLLPWANLGAYVLNILATYLLGTSGVIGKTNSEGTSCVCLAERRGEGAVQQILKFQAPKAHARRKAPRPRPASPPCPGARTGSLTAFLRHGQCAVPFAAPPTACPPCFKDDAPPPLPYPHPPTHSPPPQCRPPTPPSSRPRAMPLPSGRSLHPSIPPPCIHPSTHQCASIDPPTQPGPSTCCWVDLVRAALLASNNTGSYSLSFYPKHTHPRGLIFLAEGVFSIYQLLPKVRETAAVQKGVGPCWILMVLLQAGYVPLFLQPTHLTTPKPSH